MTALGNPTLYEAAKAADEAWQAELVRLFGKDAGTVRYTATARGDPGSELRRLYERYREAQDAWHDAWQERGAKVRAI